MTKLKQLKYMLCLVLALVCNVAWADGPFRNHRYDSFKVLEPTEGSILFIGNSITDMHCWPEVFKTSDGKYLPIVNRGNSGTYSTEQSDNLESYLVKKPKKVFMMIGTNDIATSGGLNFSPEQVLAYVKSMVTRIHARSPQTKVYLYSILKNNTPNRVEATWLKANQLTKAYADATDKVTYIDLYDKLANVASGGAWSYDNLHLTAGAYQVWAKEICQYLQEGEDFTVSTVYPDNTLSAQNNGGLGGANGMRATYFSALPISKNDVLIFGDSFIKNGEWQELLGNPNVKNRGTGWGNSGDIATTSKIVDATFAEVEGVTKESPKAILLYTGTGDCTGSTDMETVKANYKALVDKILQKSPNSIVYLLTLCFRNNESHNKRIQELNGYMAGFPMEYANLRFVDTGKQLLNNGEMDSKYIFSNDYIGGLAYVKIANLLKDAIDDDFPDDVYTVIDDATAEARYAQAGLRNQLTQAIARGLVAERGDAAGQYNATKMADFDAKVSAANTILEKTNITQDEVTTFTGELNTILNGALSMPTNSTQGNEVWYQLFTPSRGNKYLTSTGAGASVTSSAANNYATSMWKFVNRTDSKGLDIINRHDGSYLSPTAAASTPLTTSATQPTEGWTLSYCDTPGLFIVSSDGVQIHQTNGAEIWNWGGGSNRNDAGCQYQIEAVEGEPDEIPDPSVMTLTLTTNEFQSGQSTWTKNVSSSDGWYGKFVTGTTPAVTVESTDKSVNNMGWSSKRPWLQTGYSYNISLPEGFVIVGYELTTLQAGGFSGTYTYTTAEGTTTSPAQTGSEQTVSPNGLSTRTITLTVGSGTDGTKGIMMTNLVIKYKLIEKTYTIDKENGNLYKDNGTSANQSWNSAWRSNAEPQLVFSCPANNMNWVDNNVQMMAGQAGSATYTLTAPEGFVITDYSFTFANNNHDTGLTLTMNGEAYTTSQEEQTISATRQSLSSTSFVLAGTNGKGVILTDYTVTIVDAELAAAQTEAWATVEGNAGNLKDAPGYFSYTIGNTKVYNAQEVMEAIDKAASVADIESIVASYHVNLPEVGKYYRIAYDYGNNGGVKYLQSTYHSGSNLALTDNKNESSLFYVEQVGENLRLKSYTTGKYIKEDGTTRGLHDVGGNVSFSAGSSIGKIKIQAPSYLHANGNNNACYLDHCSGDGGHATHNFIVEEVVAYKLTVNVPSSKVAATATWNGITKALPATWAFFEGVPTESTVLTIHGGTYTCTGLTENDVITEGNTINTGDLTADRTITASFAPAFLSANYGDKWVRLQNCSNNGYWAKATDTKGATATKDNAYTDDSHLWCLVGDANGFVLYNKAIGSEKALEVANYSEGTAATFVAKTGAIWKLKEQDFGYALVPASADNTAERGVNMWGGGGGDLKLFATGNSNTGSYWKIEAANPLTIGIEVEEGQPYATNTRVAELTKVIAGASSKTIITNDVDAVKYYLPTTTFFSLTNNVTYRGYTFDGFVDEESNAVECNNIVLPEGGLTLTASYSVDEDNKYQYLFYSNDPVMNKPYRIPAIAVTRKGTILAVTDHRPGGSDVGFAEVDLKIRRSNDNGQTWTDEEFIANGTGQHVTVGDVTHTNVFNYAFGDAALVADRESDEVLIMCVGGKQNFPGATANSHNYIARLRSHDGGVTWDEPENVTANFMDVTPLYNNENPKGYEPILPNAYSMFYGSGRIFQSRVFKAEGSQYYRIYAALLVREVRENETGASHNNYVVYSDNFGETWNLLGGRCVNGGDEAKVEELPDGTIIISSRKAAGRYFNIFTFTDIANAEGSWGTTATSTQVYDGGNNGTDGEIYKVKAIRNSDKAICDVMLQSVPLGPGRSNVMIHYKEMEYKADGTNKYTPAEFATGWNRGLQVSDKESAYSTLALQTDGNFGFFFEEVPNGYCMVYVPLSLEEITKEAYSLYTVNSTISEHGIGTFYASEAMQIPEGVKAYVVEADDLEMNGENGYIAPTELEGIIPANTGAILMGDAETYKFIPSISYGTPVEGNMLVGYEGADNKADSQSAVTLPEGSTVYVLAVENEVAGFYKKEAGFNVYNNKAYLNVPGSAGARAIYFDFGGETGILETENGDVKTENCYDLSGRRVVKAQKGIYIVNGKKVVY